MGGSSPALMCIAGMYPGLSAEDVRRPVALPIPPPGRWTYHVLTGDTCSSFVTVPGSDLLDHHPNSVVVVASSSSLQIELSDGQEHEVLVVVDRSDKAINDPNWLRKGVLCLGGRSGHSAHPLARSGARRLEHPRQGPVCADAECQEEG